MDSTFRDLGLAGLATGVLFVLHRQLRAWLPRPGFWLAVGIISLHLLRVLCSILLRLLFQTLGSRLQRQSQAPRKTLLREAQLAGSPSKRATRSTTSGNARQAGTAASSMKTREWSGVVGFFHPFCNAGGGGERVLWAAIHATQKQWPQCVCVIYTGDQESKDEILLRAKERFGIQVDSGKTFFRHLSSRRWVLASTWPRFTLLGQSLGSAILGLEALSSFVPDIFIDTMGYAYVTALAKLCLPEMPVGSYVHYPTISTDMLGSLDMQVGRGIHAGQGQGLRGQLKKLYWKAFAKTYSWAGGHVDVVMTNSSWTQSHISALWSKSRTAHQRLRPIKVLFPPTAVEELEKAIAVDATAESQREPFLIYIAQFRSEKNHSLIIKAFAHMMETAAQSSTRSRLNKARLILVGSIRDDDDAKHVYELRLLAHERRVKEQVEFICNATWSEIQDWLARSSVGVNGMWNEHFGIGVVEYQAAGLISVVNDSGGPKLDIVVDYNGGPTGYHASSIEEYADGFAKALSLSPTDALKMRQRARASAQRFSEESFEEGWIENMDQLIEIEQQASQKAIS